MNNAMTDLNLPDIAAQALEQASSLDWVGMNAIALPLLFQGERVNAKARAGVSLDDANARGIHMSRLYLALEQLEQAELTPMLIREVLQQFLHSHQGLSCSAYLDLTFDVLIKRPALVSPLSGWKSYPVGIHAQLNGGVFHVELTVEVDYSSTCPCSAALARQLIQQQFITDFEGKALLHEDLLAWLGSADGIVATPHSQRSTAVIETRLNHLATYLPAYTLIDTAEAALGTAVQTAVKRADEQAFALANGQNLMFCEDAARRLSAALKCQGGIEAFRVGITHAESLHAHDAVARASWNW
jgi:GTP cyclohydrolase I